MITSRRFALASAAIVLGLSACGSASTTGGAGSTAGTVVTAATSGATPTTPRVIHLGSSSTGSSTAGGEVAPMAADSKMMAFRNITYVFDGAVPTLAGSGASWQLPAGFTPDQARITAMAAALGVEGEVRELPTDQGGGWMMGPQDYSGATFTVSADSLGSWWFSPAPTVSATTSACVYGGGDVISPDPAAPPADEPSTDQATTDLAPLPAGDATTVEPSTGGASGNIVAVPPECADPTPPADVPDQAAAVDAATALMTSLGYDPSAYDLDFYGDEWSASVTAYLLLGGQRSQISLNLGFGGDGAISWASGSLATPVQSDDYPLADVQTGLDRLNDQAQQWMSYGRDASSEMRTEGAISGTVESSTGSASGSTSSATAEPGDATTTAAVAPIDTTGIAVGPVQCDPAADCVPIDAEPITIHLTDVRLDTTMIWDDDGTTWLLPAYTFTDADGGTYSIIAVADEFLDVPSPVAVPLPEPLPVDTTGATTPGTTGDTTLDTVAVDPSASTPDVAPVDQAAATAALVGLDEQAATDAATANGWSLRVTERDGVSLPVTADYSSTRVDVAVTGGLVTAITSIG